MEAWGWQRLKGLMKDSENMLGNLCFSVGLIETWVLVDIGRKVPATVSHVH